MIKRCALLVVTLSVLAAFGCSREEASAPGASPGAAASAGGDVARIPILPGYTYYAGGPVMKADSYGRYRLSDFLGPVQQPPSRGMIFGAKRDGDNLEYRVWGNGVLLGMHRGRMKDGLYWEDYGESYRDGKLVAREYAVNDDEIRRTKLTTEDIDPETGEVIRTKEASLSYLPPKFDMDDDDEEDDEEDDEAAPAPPAASAPAGAPKGDAR